MKDPNNAAALQGCVCETRQGKAQHRHSVSTDGIRMSSMLHFQNVDATDWLVFTGCVFRRLC